MDQSGQKVQTSNYKIKSPEGHLLYTMITVVNDAVLQLKVARTTGLKSSHHKKNIVIRHGDGS